MKHRELGSSGIEVSEVCLGCYPFEGGTTWEHQEEADSIATIEAALNAGITFFDTAEAYGDGYAEELLGRVLGARRDSVIVGTKVSADHLRPKDLAAACDRSLARLGTDYIDLYQVHWPNREVPSADVVGALEELREAGKIRAIGVSNFGVRDLADFARHGALASNQLPYNLLWRAIEFEVVPSCLENGVSVLTYSSLMQGLLTGKYRAADDVPVGRARTKHYSGERELATHGEAGLEQETFACVARLRAVAEEAGYPLNQLAVAWLLRQPGVASVLVGARTPSQVLQNVPGADIDAPDMVFEELSAATEELKSKFGPDPDMWRHESRYR